jgi:hypothetical protein
MLSSLVSESDKSSLLYLLILNKNNNSPAQSYEFKINSITFYYSFWL